MSGRRKAATEMFNLRLAKVVPETITHPHRLLFRVETRRPGEANPIHVAFFIDEDKAEALAEKAFLRGLESKVIDANGNIRAEFEQ